MEIDMPPGGNSVNFCGLGFVDVVGPCLGQLGPIFEQKWVYLRLFEAILGRFWGHLGTPRIPRESPRESPSPGEPPGESQGESLIGPLSLNHPFWDPKLALFWSFLGSFFGPLFGHFLNHFWVPFWGPFWDPKLALFL